MNQIKIELLQTLKKVQSQLQFQTEHILVILLENRVTVSEARRYINQKYPESRIKWDEIGNEDIWELSKETEKYVQENGTVWRQRELNYPLNKQRIIAIKQQLLPKLQIQPNNNHQNLLSKLQGKRRAREQLLAIHMNTESQSIVQEENKQMGELSTLLMEIIEYEKEQKLFSREDDAEKQANIDEILRRNAQKTERTLQNKKEQQQQLVLIKMQYYDRKLILLKKRLYQIFLSYCRKNKSSGLTFEAYNKTSQMIDLRIFLKYFKDFQYVQTNKYRYKVTNATQMFRNTANSGLSLNFQQFWQIHKQLFALTDLQLTRMNIIEADIEQLPYLKEKWEEEIVKLKELNEIVTEEKTKQILNRVNPKTESSPQKELLKNHSLSILPSRGLSKPTSQAASKYSNSSKFQSKYSSSRVYSERDELSPIRRKNFIQQVREEIYNTEQSDLIKSKPQRSGSLNSITINRKIQPDLNLPKILKLSKDELSHQGIYKSLKHFSKHDYLAQQQKIKDIIGISNGQDDDYMRLLIRRQQMAVDQKIRQKSREREIKKKIFIENQIHKQHHHCRRFKPEDVEPYMKF